MKVQFFKDVGVRDDGISNMLVKFPSLLTFSLYKKIRPVVSYYPPYSIFIYYSSDYLFVE